MGIYFSGSDRPIDQNSSFLGRTAPTQGGNNVSITVAKMEIQYSASLFAFSVMISAQTSM